MKRPDRKQRLVAEINITPFTDVILVLLVIFMITTPLISDRRLNVNLPEAKSGKPNEQSRPEPLDITITREGPVYLNGKVVNKKEFRQLVRSMHEQDPDLSVVVRSDRFVKFQDVVNILDPLSELGITKISIAATSD